MFFYGYVYYSYIRKKVANLTFKTKKFAEFYGVTLDYFGVSTNDEIFELISRAREVFNNSDIPTETKENLYKEFMRLYLDLQND